MSAARTKADRRRIRRAIGPQALDALTSMDELVLEVQRFLLIRYSFRKRLRFFLTGRF